MDTVIRNVDEMNSQDRQAVEHLLGQRLRENQQLVIQVIDLKATPGQEHKNKIGSALPDWCNVYAGLSDTEVAELERTILTRADLSRPSE